MGSLGVRTTVSRNLLCSRKIPCRLVNIFWYDFIVILMEQFRETGRVGIEEERGSLPQE